MKLEWGRDPKRKKFWYAQVDNQKEEEKTTARLST